MWESIGKNIFTQYKKKLSIRAQTVCICGDNKRLVFLYMVEIVTKIKWKVIVTRFFCNSWANHGKKKNYNRHTKDKGKKYTKKSFQKIIK